MRRTLALLVLVIAAAAAGCGGEDDRDRVARYVRDANAVQERSAAEFSRANEVYARLSQGRLPDARAQADAARVERALRGTRAELAKLEPPSSARLLHRRLLRVFDANAAFAGETTQLARYVPAAAAVAGSLERITARLRSRLRRAADPATQAAALGRYVRGVERQRRRLVALESPPVLRPTHRAQVARMRRASALAGELRDAVRERDSRSVARLLLRFGRLGRRRSDEGDKLAAPAVRAYNERYRMLSREAAAVYREQSRLARDLG